MGPVEDQIVLQSACYKSVSKDPGMSIERKIQKVLSKHGTVLCTRLKF